MFKIIFIIAFILILTSLELSASHAYCMCNPNLCISYDNVNGRPVFGRTIECYRNGAVYAHGMIMSSEQYNTIRDIFRVISLFAVAMVGKILYDNMR